MAAEAARAALRAPAFRNGTTLTAAGRGSVAVHLDAEVGGVEAVVAAWHSAAGTVRVATGTR